MRRITCIDTGEVVFNYKDYLKTEHWFNIRRECIDACGGICLECKHKRKLQVHHLHYKTLGNEDRCDLKPMCRECHKSAHGITNKKPKKKKKRRKKKKLQSMVVYESNPKEEAKRRKIIEAGMSERGGFTRKQLAEWGVGWPAPKGWKKNLIRDGFPK